MCILWIFELSLNITHYIFQTQEYLKLEIKNKVVKNGRNALDEFDLLREAKTIMNTLYRKAISYKINIIENYKMKI